MNWQERVSLAQRNTLGIDACAEFFAAVSEEAELAAVLAAARCRDLPLMVLGGGSNIVLAGDVAGLVLQPALRGIRCVAETSTHFLVEAGAGESWHGFVQYSLAQGWYGLENLALIPGTVGASPIQNIGAYGLELTDRFHSLTAMAIDSGELREFSHSDCHFAYRDSVFKQALAQRYVITRVRFLLLKQPQLRLDYGDVRQELAAQGVSVPGPRDVAAAIIALRQRKLPDPAVLGNAGSFFKNPRVSAADFARLQQAYPGLPAYPQDSGEMKLAAGWLIEQAGWKGRRLGPVGAYEKQALVLVNHGGARGSDVLAAARAIQAAVWDKFAVRLEMEPLVYGAEAAAGLPR